MSAKDPDAILYLMLDESIERANYWHRYSRAILPGIMLACAGAFVGGYLAGNGRIGLAVGGVLVIAGWIAYFITRWKRASAEDEADEIAHAIITNMKR